MAKKDRGLGRGLEALLSGDVQILNNEQVVEIAIEKLAPRKDQPRTRFSEKAIQELAESIVSHGMLQPLLVRPQGETYEIIAGERRWRAAQVAGLSQLPALIRQLGDREAAEISLVENIQREDLTVVEEAKAYKSLMETYGYTQEQLAEKVGKSRVHVANTIRILTLPAKVVSMVEEGLITAGHARALLSLPDAAVQIHAAADIVKEHLSVRAAEKRAKETRAAKRNPTQEPGKKPLELLELEEQMQQHFSTRVEFIPGQRGGKIQITYYDNDDLERIMELLKL